MTLQKIKEIVKQLNEADQNALANYLDQLVTPKTKLKTSLQSDDREYYSRRNSPPHLNGHSYSRSYEYYYHKQMR